MNLTKIWYNNMVIQGTWKQAEARDSKIMALLTKVNNLEDKLKYSTRSSSSSSGQSSKSPYFTLDDWQIKKDGDSKEMDGKTWYWFHGIHRRVFMTEFMSLINLRTMIRG